jgi:hypothetical protein
LEQEEMEFIQDEREWSRKRKEWKRKKQIRIGKKRKNNMKSGNWKRHDGIGAENRELKHGKFEQEKRCLDQERIN